MADDNTKAVALLAVVAAVKLKADYSPAKLSLMIAALMDITPRRAKEWLYQTWKSDVAMMIANAKAAGRLDADGNVVESKLTAGKGKPKKEPSDSLHGVKSGRVTKKSAKKGKGGKGSKKESPLKTEAEDDGDGDKEDLLAYLEG